MKPGTALLVMLPLVAMVTAFVLVGTRGAGARPDQDGVYWDEYAASFVRRRVAQTYVDELDRERAEDAFYQALGAYVGQLDEYSTVIPPDEHRKWEESTAGEYAGLGVKVQDVSDGLLVAGVLPGGPAQRAGIRPGDTLVEADGQPLAEVGIERIEATRLLKGEPGSTVKITYVRGPRPETGPATGARVVVPVERAVVRPPTVFERRVGPDANIGVIRLTEFAEATQEDFDKALDAMLASGVEGLVLDLRYNGGGVLPTAVAIANRFIDAGIIVRMEGRAPGATRQYDAKAENTISKNIPLIVLVNGRSASASEVVAGALQDHRRALLVGERTYGKFLVQSITDIPGRDAGLQLTTSRYYLPSGRSYQRPPTKSPAASDEERPAAGILPDVIVPSDAEGRDKLRQLFRNQEAVPWGETPMFDDVSLDWVDPQLQRAVELLQGQLVLRRIRPGR